MSSQRRMSFPLTPGLFLRLDLFPTPLTKMLANDNSGLFTIRDYRDAISQDDLNRAVRKVAEAKKLEGKIEYQKL